MKPIEFVGSYFNMYLEKERLVKENSKVKLLNVEYRNVYNGLDINYNRLVELDNVYEQMLISQNEGTDALNAIEKDIERLDAELSLLKPSIIDFFGITNLNSIVMGDGYYLYVNESDVVIEKM